MRWFLTFVSIIPLIGCAGLELRFRDPKPATIRFCLVQREVVLRRGEVLRTAELQPCIPAVGEFEP